MKTLTIKWDHETSDYNGEEDTTVTYMVDGEWAFTFVGCVHDRSDIPAIIL